MIQQYRNMDSSRNRNMMSMDEGEVSYDSEEQRNQQNRNTSYAADINVSMNETQDSFKQTLNTEDDQAYVQAAQLFSQFYQQQLLKPKKSSNKYNFENHKLFDKYRKNMKVYPPCPNLYFLPTRIIISGTGKLQQLIPLRDSIVKQFGDFANVQTHNDRISQILVTIHDQFEMSHYIIRFNSLIGKYRLRNPQALNPDLSLNPLYRFYSQNYGQKLKFDQTCGILLYWAYRKRLLNTDYLNQSALKLIVMFFYFTFGCGAPNIITMYLNKQNANLQKLTKMYRVNKNLECELQDQLFNSVNFSISQKRSFYRQSQKKYTTMTNILPIPFPVEQDQLQQYKKITKPVEVMGVRGNQPRESILLFLSMIQFFQNTIKRQQKVIFDFVKDRKGYLMMPSLSFNIEIIHPIFRNNICETLTNDPAKLKILEQHISNVASIRQNNGKIKPIQALDRIFDAY